MQINSSLNGTSRTDVGTSPHPASQVGIKKHLSVLVVEDDFDDFYLTQKSIQCKSDNLIHLTRAKSLNDAFSALQNNTFDVILLDLGLPESSGLETLSQCMCFADGIPIIVITGVSDKSLGIEAIKLGADNYIPKAELQSSDLAVSILFSMERHSHLKALEEQATHDVLTKLPNRLGLEQHVEHRLAKLQRQQSAQESLWVVMLDLDGFKQINDDFGHAEGDKLLCAVADVLITTSRSSDFIARLGGDEFVVWVEADNLQATHELISRCKGMIEELRRKVPEWCITASFGIAAFNDFSQPFSAVLGEADSALYEAKANGKNRIVLH